MTHTVVIAEDDPDIRGLVAIAAAKAGLDVLDVVSDGRAALNSIRLYKPDLAILDISMPELTGIEVCRAVRADESIGDVRIVLLSASVEAEAIEQGLGAGADHFFPKPFSTRALVEWLAVGKEVRP